MVKRTLLLAALLSLLLAGPASAKLLYVGDSGVATVGKVPCRGDQGCRLQTPQRVMAKVGQRLFWAKVLAPRRIAPGRRAKVRVKLGDRALAALAGRTTTILLAAVVRQGEAKARTRLLKIRLRRAALAGQPAPPPTSGPLNSEPPLLARPATAVDVSDVEVTWFPRDSWVRYVHSGGGSFFADGASGVLSEQSPCPYDPGAPVKQAPPGLPFTVNFLPRPSWYDPVSKTAGIYGGGAVTYRYSARGINLTAADPEIEINGAASRAIFRFAGSENTPLASQRAALVNLDVSGQPATTANGGKTLSYTLMRGALTADGVSIFAGFYQQATNFGCVSVSFTTP